MASGTLVGEVKRIEDGSVRIEYKDEDDEFDYEWVDGDDYKKAVGKKPVVGAKVKCSLVHAGCGWDLNIEGAAE